MTEQWVCEHCGRRLRPFKAKIVDYPGTCRAQAMTCCTTCAARIADGIPLPDNDYEYSRCHKMVATELPKPKGRPGPAIGGVCLPCAAARGKGSPTVRSTHCVDCGGYMVTTTEEKHEIAWSVYRHNASQCSKCYYRAKRSSDVDEPELPRFDPAEGLDAFLRARRARKANQARLEAARRTQRARAADYSRRVGPRRVAS